MFDCIVFRSIFYVNHFHFFWKKMIRVDKQFILHSINSLKDEHCFFIQEQRWIWYFHRSLTFRKNFRDWWRVLFYDILKNIDFFVKFRKFLFMTFFQRFNIIFQRFFLFILCSFFNKRLSSSTLFLKCFFIQYTILYTTFRLNFFNFLINVFKFFSFSMIFRDFRIDSMFDVFFLNAFSVLNLFLIRQKTLSCRLCFLDR